MAISAVNVTWLGLGPTVTNEVLAQASTAGDFARTLVGTASWVSDGADTDVTINWVDGTAVLPFTPSGVIITRTGGTGAATIAPLSVTSITATSALVTISASGNLNDTLIFTVAVFK